VEHDNRVRLRAGLISLVVAIVLLGAKWWAYVLTGSMAVFSDALESIVNVVAAAFAIGGLVFAHEPADRNHPYGHGKIEFFSAAFEGGLIAFAAALILWESVGALFAGSELKQLDAGLWITAAAGAGNAVLGVFLVRTGRRHHSMTLVADGQHVLSDFWTSVGIIAGLGLVWLTGLAWLDPVVAIVVALLLLWTGGRLVRTAAAGLLDEEDPELLDKLVAVLQPHIGRGMIRLHHLRAIRAGRFHHVSAHLVVPGSGPCRWPTTTPTASRRASSRMRASRANWCSTPIPATATTARCATSMPAPCARSRLPAAPRSRWRKPCGPT
jgi:cation diffusion facilitator family transporter